MWFNERKQNVAEVDLEHWPTERMIESGHAEYATPEDLEGLPEERLIEIASLCQVDQYAPDECISCLAHVMLMEKREEEKARLLALAPHILQEDEAPFPDPGGEPEVPEAEEIPVVERFVQQVEALSDLVAELLEGPPIPPPGVSTEELAALVVGAERWINIMDGQGIQLAPQQEAVKNEIARVVAKVKR